VHDRATIAALLQPATHAEREFFMRKSWNTWRWRALLAVFFSRFTMGRLGRDPAFFDHVHGSVAAHVARRTVHALVDTDPSANPYLHWILTGTHGKALPLALRPEHFETIRDRLERIDVRRATLETFLSAEERADGFNLSDIFEYMTADTFAPVYRSIVDAANPGARLVYWNMMVPRRAPPPAAARVRRLSAIEERCKAMDKAFFYSDFVVEEVA
jgi:S-adenosylmethionine-diacylglycerol 3-amino-3-carboxypropyl transferase